MKREYQIVKKDRQGLDAVKVPTALEIAWTAGLYEGEGSCVVSGSKRNSFAVLISQKDPELLYWLRGWFGGGVRFYNVGKQKQFSIYHWVLCGDKARVFLGVIYPYLTARRKSQIESTTASLFLENAQDLLVKDTTFGSSLVYAALWERINQIDVAQRTKAREHKKKREAEWYSERSQDPAFMEHKRLAQQERRKIKKEQLQVAVTNLVAIA